MPGKIEGKLREVAGVYAEVDVGPVERAVEKLSAIADDEIAIHRSVAERPRGIAGQQRARCARDRFGWRDNGFP
jgi:hypothetical protein